MSNMSVCGALPSNIRRPCEAHAGNLHEKAATLSQLKLTKLTRPLAIVLRARGWTLSPPD